MRKITDGRHGWNLYWMNTFLFNASYMPTHTRVNVICIVWIAWMGLYVHSVCLIIKTTVLFRYAMCFFFWVKIKKKKKKSTESFAHSVVLIILFHPILVSGHLTFLSKFSAISPVPSTTNVCFPNLLLVNSQFPCFVKTVDLRIWSISDECLLQETFFELSWGWIWMRSIFSNQLKSDIL